MAKSVATLLVKPEYCELFRQAIHAVMVEDSHHGRGQHTNTVNADLVEKYGTLCMSTNDKAANEEVESEAAKVGVTDITQVSPVIGGLSPCVMQIVHGLPTKTVLYGKNNITYFIPKEGSKPPYYCIGRGLAVGIFTNWLVSLLAGEFVL